MTDEIRNFRCDTDVNEYGTDYSERFEGFGYAFYYSKATTKDGKTTYIDIQAIPEETFLPEIRYEDGPFNHNDDKQFRIQTTAWGAQSPEKIAEVIEGYKTALQVVEYLKERYEL